MKTLSKSSFLAAVVLASAASAYSATITIGGTPSGTSGYTSSYSGASITTFDSGVVPSNFTITGSGAIVSGTSSSIGTPPAGDSTPFLTTGTGSVMMSFAAAPIDYLGFYWGSVDSYNSIALTETNGTIETFTGSSLGPLGVGIHGGHSAYVNFFADAGTDWSSVKLSSSQNAFEIDNLATASASVLASAPEPASIATVGLGIGLALLGIARRRKLAARVL